MDLPAQAAIAADGHVEPIRVHRVAGGRSGGGRCGPCHPRATARSSPASRRWTSRPSPASRPRSSARRAATAPASPAAPASCPTASSCGSRPSAGKSFLDRMIALVEGAIRQRTPNEIALSLVLSAFTLIFLIVRAPCGRWPARRAYMTDYLTPTTGQEPGHRHPDAGGAAGLPDPDDDRRPAGGHRHRRHGPGAAGQHPRQERQVGRGGRRRGHAAAGQDRHHHDRQPPGDALRAAGRLRGRARSASWPRLASVADQTPEGKSIVDLYRTSSTGGRRRRRPAAGRAVRRVHGPDAHERHRSARRPQHPQGRRRRRHPPRPAAGRRRPAGMQEQVDASPPGAPRRCWCARATASPAWSCWRTSSSPASPSASSGCAAWACAP